MNNRKQTKPDSSIERRFFTSKVEVRAKDGETEKRTIGGSAAVTGVYTDMGWYLEKIEKNAFDNMRDDQCACLFNHDSNLVLARRSNDTLKLEAKDGGLDYTADVADTQTGRDVFTLIERGDVHQSSFAFTVKKSKWETVGRADLKDTIDDATLDRLSYQGKVDIRTIEEIDMLYDVSPVTYPAYQDTTVAKRSFDTYKSENTEQQGGGDDDEYLKKIERRKRYLEAVSRP